MEEIVRRTLLLDFYGELLTEHQKDIYEEVVCNDISCSEVAKREGVSRQSINELVRKSGQQMEAYEEKLQLMKRFLRIRELIGEIRAEVRLPGTDGTDSRRDDGAAHADDLKAGGQGCRGRILELCDEILEEL